MDLTEVDVAAVKRLLSAYVNETQPVNQSGGMFVTSQTAPACGRSKAIELTESVRPILNRLYPEWHAENLASKNDEFRSERDAARRLLARIDTAADVEAILGGADPSPRASASAMHPIIWGAAKTQWSTGHRHEAVLAAAKAVNSLLQAKTHRRDVSDTDLIRQSFSERSPELGKPRLRFSSLDEQTRDSLRRGVSDFGAGCFSAIRNPLGHLPNEAVDLPEQAALEQLAALSLLARWIDQADIDSI